MFKRFLILGVLTAVLSSAGAIAYGTFYNKNLFDFSLAVGPIMIAATCTFVSIFAACSAWLSNRVLGSWGEFAFNLLFSLGSMASVLMPINYEFPPQVLTEIQEVNFEGVESFFPVYTIPMHFFPVLVWISLKPLFFKKRSV
jgi:hypothetical protein